MAEPTKVETLVYLSVMSAMMGQSLQVFFIIFCCNIGNKTKIEKVPISLFVNFVPSRY
jgi:hypothetical protein